MTAERIRAGLAERDSTSKAIHHFVLKIAENVELSGYGAGGPLTTVAMETATQSERINLACRQAYGMLVEAFQDKLQQGGYSTSKATALATFITAAIEGAIILSRTYHTGDPLRLVAAQLMDILE
jgi:TetR/AcrR family transcriptional repressor of lmrAB and yxaGH operons